MPITIARSALRSQASRIAVGIRKLNFNNSFVQEATEGNNSIVRMNWGSRLFGFLGRVIRTISVSASAIWGWVMQRWEEFTNFNWNASDADLQRTMQQRNVQTAGAWGATGGTIFGRVAIAALGAGVAMVLPVIGGAALASLVVADVARESLDEIVQSLLQSVRVTAQNMLANVGTTAYIQFRRAVKSLPLEVLAGLFGGQKRAEFIKNEWGKEGGPSFTIAEGFDNAIEGSTNNQALRAFLENFADEGWDNFVEGGFIVAQTIDEAIANSRAGANGILGETKTVLVTPDRNVPQERYAITGKQELVKTQIQEVIHSHRRLYNKDIGEIVGQPAIDWFRAVPMRRQMVILFYSKERPPWRLPNGRRPKTATYTIPDPKPGLSWRQIKAAASVYDWGKFRATANLNNGRQMAVYGATAREAERKLRQLLQLSTAEITTLSVAEEKDRNPNVRKDSTRMYPAFVSFLVRRPTVEGQGRFIDDREWDTDTRRYPLWTENAPSDFVPLTGAGS